MIGGFKSVSFVTVIRFVACDLPLWGNHRLVFLEDFFSSFLFLSLARIKQCLPPFLDKNSTNEFPK